MGIEKGFVLLACCGLLVFACSKDSTTAGKLDGGGSGGSSTGHGGTGGSMTGTGGSANGGVTTGSGGAAGATTGTGGAAGTTTGTGGAAAGGAAGTTTGTGGAAAGGAAGATIGTGGAAAGGAAGATTGTGGAAAGGAAGATTGTGGAAVDAAAGAIAGTGGTGAGGAPASGGSGGGTTGTGGTLAAGSCPPALPSPASCTAEGWLCSYGNSPREECRDQATCTSGQWVVVRQTCAAPSPADQCPAAAPVGTVACTSTNQLCEYAAGKECLCVSIVSSSQWICDSPRVQGDPQCPQVVPNAGTACTTSGMTCAFGCGQINAKSVTAVCGTRSVWEWTNVQPCAGTGG